MTTKLYDVLDALLPAAFVATIAATILSGADYIALLSVEHFAEGEGWLLSGWAGTHEMAIAVAAFLVAVPVTGFIAWKIYRTARASQAANRRAG